jgi:hypothetical protein
MDERENLGFNHLNALTALDCDSVVLFTIEIVGDRERDFFCFFWTDVESHFHL